MGQTENRRITLARISPSQWRLALLFWVSTATMYVVGVFGPLMTTSKSVTILGVFQIVDEENRMSLVSGLRDLLGGGDVLLFAIIFVFCIVVPFIKLTLLLAVWLIPLQETPDNGLRTELSPFVHFIEKVGKWAMLDVFVVAILVVSLKLGTFVEVEVHYGVYVFAGFVVASMLLTTWTLSILRNAATGELTVHRASLRDTPEPISWRQRIPRSLVVTLVLPIALIATLSMALEMLPDEMPVEATYRESLVGVGLVLQLHNQSDRDLTVVASFYNDTLDKSMEMEVSLGPGEQDEIGWVQGWKFSSGDRVEIRHADYKTIKGVIP